ncbi:MAG: ATP-binding cassette domain-containing protein [Chloroflexi bacterium]|nr:ATP-binding cassette domain-containing protein [Chloroflexota bacterium]
MVACENLVKIYKVQDLEAMALQGLDLTVQRGELMAIVGNSGSGKTTLLNVLGGLDRPSAGSAMVAGYNLLKIPERTLVRYKREVVGFVWQQTSRNLIPYLTALQNVEVPMIIYGASPRKRRAWAQELLKQVGLADRMHHLPLQMSGGQQQRVAIAVALANNPPLLLADEPTGSVDTATAHLIFEIFRRLVQSYGTSVMIVTHDRTVTSRVDRVVSIRDGKTSTESLRRTDVNLDDPLDFGSTHEEFVVLDNAGRLQLPREMMERLNIHRKVQLEVTDGKIEIRPADEGGKTPQWRSQ